MKSRKNGFERLICSFAMLSTRLRTKFAMLSIMTIIGAYLATLTPIFLDDGSLTLFKVDWRVIPQKSGGE